MTSESTLLRKTYDELTSLRKQILNEGNQIFANWEAKIIRQSYIESAKNLAYYIALRRRNLFALQEALGYLGFSSLDHLEADVMHKIDNVLKHMSLIIAPEEAAAYSYAELDQTGDQKITANADLIFGKPAHNSTARIMVTMPPHAAEDIKLIEEMLDTGMTVARVNAAHDSPEEWEQMLAIIQKSAVKTGHHCKIYFDIAGAKVRIQAIYTNLQRPRVTKGDQFFITAQNDLRAFHNLQLVLGCSDPVMLDESAVGDRILLDDGKIMGKVIAKKPEGLIVEVKHTQRSKGETIRATKGINFPDSQQKLNVLTAKDKTDLQFAKDHADIIGFSYIQNADDIDLINQKLAEMYDDEGREVPITLKIETVTAYEQLPNILVAAAGKHPTAIMIARGDLAVEAGYYHLAEMQEEILSVCEAAHIPVIWATQVLESVAKTGVPTRSEITDVVTAARADVVMLNKGPYIIEAIKMLNQLIATRHQQYDKNTEILHELTMAKNFKLHDSN